MKSKEEILLYHMHKVHPIFSKIGDIFPSGKSKLIYTAMEEYANQKVEEYRDGLLKEEGKVSKDSCPECNSKLKRDEKFRNI